jgi:hypothetical protein
MGDPIDMNPPPGMPAHPAGGAMRDLLSNLRVGLRVAQFKPVARRQFAISRTQALTLLGVSVLLTLIYTFPIWRSIEMLTYALEFGWLSTLLASIVLPLVSAYAISVFARDPDGFSAFVVVAMSSVMLPVVAYIAIAQGTTVLVPYIISTHTPMWIIVLPYGAMLVLLLWSLGILALCLRITYRMSGMRSALLSLLLMSVFVAPAMIQSWHPAEQSTDVSSDANGNGG